MFFSKSFGYAIRGILYLAIVQDKEEKVQVEEIALKLKAPKHFMAKILKKLVQQKIIGSTKGPSGGYMLLDHTLKIPLITIYKITDGLSLFNTCSLNFKECNPSNPCPIHKQISSIKTNILSTLTTTKLSDLLKKNQNNFLKSLTSSKPIKQQRNIT